MYIRSEASSRGCTKIGSNYVRATSDLVTHSRGCETLCALSELQTFRCSLHMPGQGARELASKDVAEYDIDLHRNY